MSLAALILALAACLAVQAFFAAGEIAIVTADEIKVHVESRRGAQDAKLLASLLENRDRLLAAVLSVTNLANAVAAAALTTFLYAITPALGFLAPFVLAPLTLTLGESIPKLMTLRRPLEVARIAAAPLKAFADFLAPLIAVETEISRWIRRTIGVSPEVQSVFMTREDLARLLHRPVPQTERDAIQPGERQIISRIFRFSRVEARKVMVPLVRIEAIPDDTPLSRAIEIVRRSGFTRLPVYSRRIVNIAGIVHIFDLLEAPDLSRPVSDVMRPVSYFPEATPLDEVLVAIQRTREGLAVIVDEYGGAAGIITLEDLLEEVVGEIEDEYDASEELARAIDRQTLSVLGRAPVAGLNERFALKLPEGDDYATIGGLMVERLGHIPRPGEQLKLGDVTIAVARSDARAVRELVLHLARPLRPDLTRRR